MRVSGSEQKLCPCYKDCQEFQKLAELKDSSLVIYYYRTRNRTENIRQDEAVESGENTSSDVFILHNQKNVRITASRLTSELEKNNISCPRCRKTFAHAQELLQEVKSIERNIVIGICDHCRKKAQTIKNQFCACDEIVRKFKSVKGEQKEYIKKHVKILLSKMEHILSDVMIEHKLKQVKYRAYSDLQINRDLKSSTLGHEPEIQQMFNLETHKSDINLNRKTVLKEDYFKQGVAFSQPLISIKPVATSFADTIHERENINTMIPQTSSLGSNTIFMETSEGVKELPSTLKDRKQKEIFKDSPSMDVKEALKRRHDLSLRQMMRLEKDSGVPFSASKRPNVYEIPKIAPWEQKEPASNYYGESEIDTKIKTKHDLRHRGTYDLDHPSKVLTKYGTSRKSQNDKYYHSQNKNVDFSHKSRKLDPQVAKSKSWNKKAPEPKKTGFKPQYSFFFPKVKGKEKKKQVDVTSSHLIKSTQEKFRRQVEKKRQEKEYQHELDHNQNKIARKEKILQAEEKTRQAIEDQNKAKKDKSIEKNGEIFSESHLKRKIKKDSKSDLENRNKIDKKKSEAKKGTKSKTEEENRIDAELLDTVKVSEKAKNDLKVKYESRDKAVEGKTKIKTEEERDDKKRKEKMAPKKQASNLIDKKEDKQIIKQVKEIKAKTKEEGDKTEIEKLKQIEKMRKEREILKKQAEKEQLSKHKDAPSKTGTSTSIKQNSPGETNVSLTTIFNKNTEVKKETANKKEPVEIKQKIPEKLQDTIKEKKESKEETSKPEFEVQKLKEDYLKEKALEKKKRLELELKKRNEEAKEKERKRKEQAELKENKSKSVDLKMGDIHFEHLSKSEKFLRLVSLKQAATIKPWDVTSAVRNEHKCHHGINVRQFCPLCYNSELEMEVISLDNQKGVRKESVKDIIIGEHIFKMKRPHEKTKKPKDILNLYQNFFFDPPKELTLQVEPAQNQNKAVTKKAKQEIEVEPVKGVLCYALSDRTFIDKGWTVLPTEKVVRKMNVYRMRPAHPEFDWFEHNKNKRLMTYDTGERLAEFDDNGRGRWYYRSGRLALDYYDAEETNAQQRFVIYSSGEPDERGRTHPITILATFDYLGNGIVFDHAGKIRLKYNQTEGVVLDRSIGPVSHWKWHSLNDPPVLQQVMIDTQLPQKDPDILKLGPPSQKVTRPENEEMLAIEFDNFIKEKSKKLSQKFKPFQIKMKALKINEHFSLKVLDQATVYLIFRDGSTNLKLNIGMILDHKEIVDTETAEVGEVSNSLEQFPARTDSLAGLQRSVAHAQRYERQYAERERRLRHPEPCASADLLTAASSPPMRLPLRTVPTGSTSSTGYCSRKPTNNLYYNSRLL